MVKIRSLLNHSQFWIFAVLMILFVLAVCIYRITIALRLFLPIAVLFTLRHFTNTPKALVTAIITSSVLSLFLIDIRMFSQYWLRFALADVLLGLAVIYFIMQQTLSTDREGTKDIFTGPLLLFMIAAVISAVGATNRGASISLLLLYVFGYLLYRFIIANFHGERDLIFMSSIMLCTLILVIFFAFVNKSFTPTNTRAGIYSEARAGYIFAGPNSLATVIVALLPFCFILFAVRSIYIKIFIGTIFIIGLYLLIQTYSRNGYIAFILSTIFMIFFLSKSNYLVRPWFLVLILIPITLIGSTAITRFFTISVFSVDPSSLFRLIMWKSALTEFIKHPVTGIGLANFYYVTRLYHSGFCHNLFLSSFAEMGILGGIATIWFLLRVFRKLFSGIKHLKHEFLNNLNICLIGAWVAFAISNIFDQAWFFLDRTSEMKIFWLLIGTTTVFILKKETLRKTADIKH